MRYERNVRKIELLRNRTWANHMYQFGLVIFGSSRLELLAIFINFSDFFLLFLSDFLIFLAIFRNFGEVSDNGSIFHRNFGNKRQWD